MLLDTSLILASLDPDEAAHETCDRLISRGGHRLHVHALADAESRGVRGGAAYDYLHLAAARNAKVDALITLDVRNFQAFARPGDPRIETPQA